MTTVDAQVSELVERDELHVTTEEVVFLAVLRYDHPCSLYSDETGLVQVDQAGPGGAV